MNIPVLAGFGGKSMQYPKTSSFISLIGGKIWVDDSPMFRKYDKEMDEALKIATERMNKEDEGKGNIEERIESVKQETDKAFKEAKKASDFHEKSDALNRQYQRWAQLDRSNEREAFDTSHNREGRVNEAWKKLGEEWGSESAKEKRK